MNREILFRGKRIDNGEWVEGGIVGDIVSTYIVFELARHVKRDDFECYAARVKPETVCQFSGKTLQDQKLFDGDILKLTPSTGIPSYFEIFWSNSDSAFRVRNSLIPDSDGWGRLSRLFEVFIEKSDIKTELAGNRIDNPDWAARKDK